MAVDNVGSVRGLDSVKYLEAVSASLKGTLTLDLRFCSGTDNYRRSNMSTIPEPFHSMLINSRTLAEIDYAAREARQYYPELFYSAHEEEALMARPYVMPPRTVFS